MKKVFLSVLALVFMLTVFAFATTVGAEDETLAGPLVITEIFNNPTSYSGNTRDYTEFMEIMNISENPVDLYDYKFWYTTAKTLDTCAKPNGTNKWNVFASKPGENILQPGEIAIIWMITAESILPKDDATYPLPESVEYFRKPVSASEASSYDYTLTDYEGNIYAYNVEEFISTLTKWFSTELLWDFTDDFKNSKIIICDINIDLETPVANIEGNIVKGADAHFNMANCKSTKAVKYWVTDRTCTTFDESTKYYCAAGVEAGSYTNKSFQYITQPGTYEMTYDGIYTDMITPGYLSVEWQPQLISLRHKINPVEYTDIVTETEAPKPTESETPTESATDTEAPKPTESATTPTETEAPTDSNTGASEPTVSVEPTKTDAPAPSVTDAPKTDAPKTDAPKTDTPKSEKKSCGGIAGIASVFAVICGVFGVAVIKKH